ncbi:MAG TPA: AarF/UbiB family protein [Thermoanaerobaculia bacterium]
MIEPAQRKSARGRRTAAQARRREIERVLAELGLAGGPRGLVGEEAPSHFDGSSGLRLRLALERLGPVFAAFGRYLGSRPDLLSLADCRELRQTGEPATPLPAAAIPELIESEAGQPFTELFEAVEVEPLRCGLVTQTHRARLRGGWEALVWLVRPDYREQLELDSPHLALLATALRQGEGSPTVERAIAGFQQAMLARADLQARAGALRTLRLEVAGLGSLRLPRIVVSASRLLCLELLQGRSLDGLQPSPAPPAELADLARRLCLGWLYHAFRGKVFPVEFAPRDLVVLADDAIGLQGGTFAGLSMDSQQNLHAYLEAAAAEDPDEACARLLREMEPGSGGGAEAELRQSFRQAVAFRDGGWGSAQDGRSLAEQLFVQWRLAAEQGYQPSPQLVAFYRGLFALAVAVRPLTPPDRDPLREALENLRLLSAADRLARMADFGRFRRGLESYGAALADLPVAFDAALSQLTDGRPKLRIEVEDGGASRERDRRSPALPIALSLALVAVALLTVRLGTAPQAGAWLEAAGATLFIVLGGLLLGVLGRQP